MKLLSLAVSIICVPKQEAIIQWPVRGIHHTPDHSDQVTDDIPFLAMFDVFPKATANSYEYVREIKCIIHHYSQQHSLTYFRFG